MTSAVATTYRGNYKRNYDDGDYSSSSSSYSSHKNPSSSSAYSSFGGGRSSGGKRDYNSGFDGDDYIPPIGIQHNNDYSGNRIVNSKHGTPLSSTLINIIYTYVWKSRQKEDELFSDSLCIRKLTPAVKC